MLIDSGNDQDGYYIWQFLKAQNIDKIDYFIVTHFDEDHMGEATWKVLNINELLINNTVKLKITIAKLKKYVKLKIQ